MVSYFFVDTSALAKRYVIEVGSAWVLTWIEPVAGNAILIAELTLVEMRSMLARRVKAKTLSPNAAKQLRSDFLIHARDEYLIIPIGTGIVSGAEALVDRHGLRTLDALQLASALHAGVLLNDPITFVGADAALLTAAQAEGLSTDNPNAHP